MFAMALTLQVISKAKRIANYFAHSRKEQKFLLFRQVIDCNYIAQKLKRI